MSLQAFVEVIVVKNKLKNNKGLSLIELVVAITVLATLAAVLVPSYINMMQSSRYKKDLTKFESVAIAFKSVAADPEVRKEIEEISDNEPIDIIVYADDKGLINFEQSEIMFDENIIDFKSSSIWINTYQSIGNSYETDSEEHRDKFIVYTLTPKTTTTTATCTYEVVEEHP